MLVPRNILESLKKSQLKRWIAVTKCASPRYIKVKNPDIFNTNPEKNRSENEKLHTQECCFLRSSRVQAWKNQTGNQLHFLWNQWKWNPKKIRIVLDVFLRFFSVILFQNTNGIGLNARSEISCDFWLFWGLLGALPLFLSIWAGFFLGGGRLRCCRSGLNRQTGSGQKRLPSRTSSD